ncbi:hypothetical protein VIMS_04928 [Mycobacterium marinum]|uniref:hypothetical protein n=1 Tax=Mycobacterium marinum TaxID=1781 RepID=UPI000E3CA761|nr:hypothetical protein [Mycobacterium marinum]RFZ05426.1 hypothetical protein VIMS_04928 [Mycobacterium marinum]
MHAREWITLFGVFVSLFSAAWAVVSARRARNAQEKANHYQARAEQNAERATKAAEDSAVAQSKSSAAAQRAADAAERSAAAAEAQDRRAVEQDEAAEADPWQLTPIPGDDDCYLKNTSKTPKYGVRVSGFKIHGGPVRFDVIGPGKRVELSILRIWHDDDGVEVTWHRQADLSDPPQSRVETIPSKL